MSTGNLKPMRALAVAALLSLAAGTRARAGCIPDTLRYTFDNPAPANEDLFGIAVAVSGDLVVVGAHYDSPGGVSHAGSAYVYDTRTGALVATLNNPEPDAGDLFGVSVGISGLIAVVAAEGDAVGGAANAGTVYAFNAETGALLYTINNPSPSAGDYFGYSVRISGGRVIVGSWLDDPAGITDAGRAYIFNAANGNLLSTLENPVKHAGDQFGQCVAIAGSKAVVGAWLDGAGSASVFDAITGNLIRTLTPPSDAGGFGFSVEASGDFVIVGQPRGGAGQAGIAYVFRVSTGELISTLENPEPAAIDEFGLSVSISGDLAVVGAWLDDYPGATDAGGAYLFNARTGEYLAKLANPDPASLDYLARNVWIDGRTVAAGAFRKDPGGVHDAGTAYIFMPSGGGRAVGDFDCSGCTDLADFIYLISNWWEVTELGGPPIGLDDFFNFLGNWQSGPMCQ